MFGRRVCARSHNPPENAPDVTCTLPQLRPSTSRPAKPRNFRPLSKLPKRIKSVPTDTRKQTNQNPTKNHHNASFCDRMFFAITSTQDPICWSPKCPNILAKLATEKRPGNEPGKNDIGAQQVSTWDPRVVPKSIKSDSHPQRVRRAAFMALRSLVLQDQKCMRQFCEITIWGIKSDRTRFRFFAT